MFYATNLLNLEENSRLKSTIATKKMNFTFGCGGFSQNKCENLNASVRISDLKSLENFIFSVFFPFFMLIENSFEAPDLFGVTLASSLYGHLK